MQRAGAPPRIGPWRLELRRTAELIGVFGLAVAQPTFDLLGKNAGLFVAWNATVPRSLALVLLVILGPPLVALALEMLVGLVVPPARAGAHTVMLAIGIGVVVSEAVKHASDLGPVPLYVVGIVGAVGGAVLVARHPVLH